MLRCSLAFSLLTLAAALLGFVVLGGNAAGVAKILSFAFEAIPSALCFQLARRLTLPPAVTSPRIQR